MYVGLAPFPPHVSSTCGWAPPADHAGSHTTAVHHDWFCAALPLCSTCGLWATTCSPRWATPPPLASRPTRWAGWRTLLPSGYLFTSFVCCMFRYCKVSCGIITHCFQVGHNVLLAVFCCLGGSGACYAATTCGRAGRSACVPGAALAVRRVPHPTLPILPLGAHPSQTFPFFPSPPQGLRCQDQPAPGGRHEQGGRHEGESQPRLLSSGSGACFLRVVRAGMRAAHWGDVGWVMQCTNSTAQAQVTQGRCRPYHSCLHSGLPPSMRLSMP